MNAKEIANAINTHVKKTQDSVESAGYTHNGHPIVAVYINTRYAASYGLVVRQKYLGNTTYNFRPDDEVDP